MKVSHLMLLLGFLIGTCAQAEERIYKWTDENGEVHYSSEPPPGQDAEPFDCSRTVERSPKETKGADYDATTEAANCRDGGEGLDCC